MLNSTWTETDTNTHKISKYFKAYVDKTVAIVGFKQEIHRFTPAYSTWVAPIQGICPYAATSA